MGSALSISETVFDLAVKGIGSIPGLGGYRGVTVIYVIYKAWNLPFISVFRTLSS
jgi:predicted ATP-grasp superfamily ATP-dependent carboligase